MNRNHTTWYTSHKNNQWKLCNYILLRVCRTVVQCNDYQRSYMYGLTNEVNSNLDKGTLLFRKPLPKYDIFAQVFPSRAIARQNQDKNMNGLSITNTIQLFSIRIIMHIMMTSSNGNIFRVTGHLCGKFTGPGEFPAQRPVTRSFDVFFDLRLNKRLSKQPRGWWFETPAWSLWRHHNVMQNESSREAAQRVTFTGKTDDV